MASTVQLVTGKDGVFELWLRGLKPTIARTYGSYLRELWKMAGMTPEEAVEAVNKDIKAYIRLKELANNFTEHGRFQTIYGLAKNPSGRILPVRLRHRKEEPQSVLQPHTDGHPPRDPRDDHQKGLPCLEAGA